MVIALKMSTRMAKRMHISFAIILNIFVLPQTTVTYTPLMNEEEITTESISMTTEFTTNEPLSTSAPDDCEGRSFGAYSVMNSDDLFFVCSVGGRIDFSCREEGTFDSATGRCEEEEMAIDEPPATQRSYCQRQPNGVHPDADDCRNFVVCFSGARISFSCPEREKFNSAIGRCAETDSELGNGCAGQPSGAYPVPNSDYILFFVCVDGVRIGSSCREGTTFNSYTERCEGADMTTNVPLSTPNEICSGLPSGPYPVPTIDGDRFFVCTNQVRFDFSCREGGTFDSGSGRCEGAEITTDVPLLTPRSICVRQPNGVYGDVNDARKFIVCSNGVRIGFSCPQGQRFNPAFRSCSLLFNPERDCPGQPSGAYVNPNSDDFYVCINGARIGVLCREGRSFNPDTGRCEGAEIMTHTGSFCQVQPNGVYTDENNNRHFILCINGGRIDLLCSEGETFNGATGRCALDP